MEGGRSYQDITLLKKEEEIDARNRKDKEVKKKTCSMFPSSYRNPSESLGEREMLWEHEPLWASVSTSFSSSPKLSLLNN